MAAVCANHKTSAAGVYRGVTVGTVHDRWLEGVVERWLYSLSLPCRIVLLLGNVLARRHVVCTVVQVLGAGVTSVSERP